MIVINDLCGDEDDYYLTYEFFLAALHKGIYNNLLNIDWRISDDS